MADSKLLNPSNPASPPPNCAICLGSCSNKCFSDTCMHQFCFSCLLQWSKIKPECPLCKQPFKSIIHNVKSNEDYEEHIVEQPRPVPLLDDDRFHLIIPQGSPPPPAHHRFHFRTTFTVNTHGENAIQQMLMSHSLTNGITISNYLPHSAHFRPRRRQRATTTNFRRSIYDTGLWASLQPETSNGSIRVRQITPEFFRENPATRGRLVPWLNRELNALLEGNTQQIRDLVDRIMDLLLRHHICSVTFRQMLRISLGNRTDRFIHEFYTFMRSPFDMIGYDRHVNYYDRPTTPTPYIDDSESNSSDVMIVEDNPEVIEVLSSDSDDVIMTSTFIPRPRMLPDVSSRRCRRVSVSSSSESDEPRREEGRPRKQRRRKSQSDRKGNTRVSREQQIESDDEDSSSSVLDDVPLAKYMRIKASIGKKLMKKSSSMVKSKNDTRERRHKVSSHKGMRVKRKIPETASNSSKAHCSKFPTQRSDSSSFSSSSSSSSSSSPEYQPRPKRNRERSPSSSRCQTPTTRQPSPKIRRMVPNIPISRIPSSNSLELVDRINGEYAAMCRSSPASTGEGPSSAVPTRYPPLIEEDNCLLGTRTQNPNVENDMLTRVYSWRDNDCFRREKASRDVMNRYKQHLLTQQLDPHNSLLNAPSSSTSSPPRVYIPSSYYNDRTSPDLIDLSVTSRIKHEAPLTASWVPPEIRARFRLSPRPRLLSACAAEALSLASNSFTNNTALPSTSCAPYSCEGSSNGLLKTEPSYPEYQSEGSTKYWTDLSTQSHTNSNDSSCNYNSQQTRKSVIQNSRDNSVPPQNEIISPRWSSSNSPSYPSYPANWSDNSD